MSLYSLFGLSPAGPGPGPVRAPPGPGPPRQTEKGRYVVNTPMVVVIIIISISHNSFIGIASIIALMITIITFCVDVNAIRMLLGSPALSGLHPARVPRSHPA